MKLFIFFILILINLIRCEQNYQSYFRREHSLVKPYQGKFNFCLNRLSNFQLIFILNFNQFQGSGMTIPNWDFYGSTIVTQSFIRLTPDQQSKQGGLFNRIVIYLPYFSIIISIITHHFNFNNFFSFFS